METAWTGKKGLRGKEMRGTEEDCEGWEEQSKSKCFKLTEGREYIATS